MVRVLACGVFDCLHVGHVVHLLAAKALGDHLTVALTIDGRVGKGPGRPVFSWHEREQMLSALRCVDCVVTHYDIEATIRRIQPDIYVKGKEYDGALIEEGLCRDLGIDVVFLDTSPVYHSTDILSGEFLRDRIRAAGQRGEQSRIVRG